MMADDEKSNLSLQIKSWALEEGFTHCGIARAEKLSDHDVRLADWLDNGYAADMNYLFANHEKRVDPQKLHVGAISVISVLHAYYPGKSLQKPDNYKIAKYAYGKDYHKVIRKKLKKIIHKIERIAGPVNARAFTDSAPVLERAWAQKSGLGWIGKNTCLINPQAGSYFFIGEIIIDKELQYDSPGIKDFCGGCIKCLDACPTGALVEPRILDSRKCISYLTIENKKELPEQFQSKFNGWIFGCDICQDVCPWNRIARPHNEPQFIPSPELTEMNRNNWDILTQEKFDNIFSGSAVRRAGYAGLRRNIKFVSQQ